MEFQIQDYVHPFIFFVTIAYSDTSSTDNSLYVNKILIKNWKNVITKLMNLWNNDLL